MDLGMARQIDEHSCEPAGVEIHRDRISISRFLDRGTVGQYVQAGKTEDLNTRLDPVRLPRGGLGSTRKKDWDCKNRPQEHKTSRTHRPNSHNGVGESLAVHAQAEIVWCPQALCRPTWPRNSRLSN